MNFSNFKPFFTLLIAVVVLFSCSLLLKNNIQWLGYTIKTFDLLAEIKNAKNPFSIAEIQNENNEQLFISDSMSIAVDSLLEKDFSAATSDLTSVDSLGSLDYFFQALKSSQEHGARTRIAYFGDSMIEGDLITQDLRNSLQHTFGGSGVGFVPITSVVAGFRQTVVHTFSDNWKDFTLLKSDTQLLHKPGISGHVFLPVNTLSDSIRKQFSWVKYGASKKFKKLSRFQKVKLYYGKGYQQNKVYAEFNGSFYKHDLLGNQLVNELLLNDRNNINELKINFNIRQNVPIYGVSFESDSGVILDNFSFRGNSGLGLTNIPQKILKELNHYLDYKLVILHYGLNVASPAMKDYAWYEAGMKRVISHVKSCFPNASILLISVSDKSYKENTQFVTLPSIPYLVKAQERIARKNKVAFWNLYEAMGGYNSMVNWVEGDTVLANKDYTHLNFKGARKVADLIYKHLMSQYMEASSGQTNQSDLFSFKK